MTQRHSQEIMKKYLLWQSLKKFLNLSALKFRMDNDDRIVRFINDKSFALEYILKQRPAINNGDFFD